MGDSETEMKSVREILDVVKKLAFAYGANIINLLGARRVLQSFEEAPRK